MNVRTGTPHRTALSSAGAAKSVRLLRSLRPQGSNALLVLWILAALQTGHFIEHLVQVAQVHVLHMPEAQARGIASFLDEEPVHFVFNLGVLLCVAGLRVTLRSNAWLRVCLPLTAWHAFEHWFRLWAWLHGEGLAGLLGKGGLILGGLPLGERALHFGYNLAEVILLIGALLVEARAQRSWRSESLQR